MLVLENSSVEADFVKKYLQNFSLTNVNVIWLMFSSVPGQKSAAAELTTFLLSKHSAHTLLRENSGS